MMRPNKKGAEYCIHIFCRAINLANEYEYLMCRLCGKGHKNYDFSKTLQVQKNFKGANE